MKTVLFPESLVSAGQGPCIRSSFVSILIILLVGQLVVPVTPEIIELDMILDASSDEVHFVRGFLKAPATVNLTNVQLITNEDLVFDLGDDGYDINPETSTDVPNAEEVPSANDPTEAPVEVVTEAPVEALTEAPVEAPVEVVTDAPVEAPVEVVTDVPTPAEDGGDGKYRNLEETTSNQIMDIVFFTVTKNCKRDRWGNCDWVELGIGEYDKEMEGGMSYCCSKDTAERGICSSDHIGTMMVDHNHFQGEHRKIEVPANPLEEFSMDEPVFDVKVTGDYFMVIANCNDDGLGVITLGNMEWKSVTGYLAGNTYGLVYSYAGLAAGYLLLAHWYYFGMRIFQDAAIPIQKYILFTIVLSFLETSMQGLSLYLLNTNGKEDPYTTYIALGFRIIQQGAIRCVGLMVGMGWGVVRDTLGAALWKVIFFGLLYSGLLFVRDSLELASESVKKASTQQTELFDLAQILSWVIIVVNLIFVCWLIMEVGKTTDYLRNMNQTTKLRRHLRLRCLLIASMVIISAKWIFSLVQFVCAVYGNPVLSPHLFWIIDVVGHANYLFIIFGVSILWRPNSDAKSYAMQMELPALDDENELELSCVVPSADDMDDEGFKVDSAILA
eukprot:CAMPEP_0201216454 /NCGR_PEP_ID=MMETSP0851-20130426/189524_1 /ASSEMBLY_ACC=CAM_ASM_000631 /TAXON_ID=183588 /ORGANISM="Pseudo-nitzschia fraudulenta, Strain WWA7" /LENGTH=612 /DNA_ID=CAMNT_0047506019 /DNA_START=372 /DNA_END=2210 /DNA_ORIENTATION=-